MTRINERIRVPEVRLIDDEGQQVGVLKTADALQFAQERDLDLVEVAPEARPPVCRVLDYSKYKYEQAQKLKQARKHQQQITVREIKFRPKIAEHDYDTKKHHVERFLRHKDKVKVTIMFRGREVTHPERGTAILDRLAEELSELGVVEQRPMQEGRNMTMMMAPSKAVLAGRLDTDGRPRSAGDGAVGADGGRPGRAGARCGPEPTPVRPGGSRGEAGRHTPAPSERGAPPSSPGALPAKPRCGGRGHGRAIISGSTMPKMKTHSGAKKRFKVTGGGKVRGRHAFTSHILEKKSPKRSAPWARPAIMSDDDVPRVKRMLGVGANDQRQAVGQRAQEAPLDARADEGLPRRGALQLQARQGGAAEGGRLRLPRPAQPQARLPAAVDHPHQRGRARERDELLAVHARARSSPAWSSTARCSPTSPSATPRRSDVSPTSPARRRLPDPPGRRSRHRHRQPHGRRS